MTAYTALASELRRLRLALDDADRRLPRMPPGSAEGRELAELIGALGREHDRLRREIRNHPDAPSAG